jgi:hypothetical protein
MSTRLRTPNCSIDAPFRASAAADVSDGIILGFGSRFRDTLWLLGTPAVWLRRDVVACREILNHIPGPSSATCPERTIVLTKYLLLFVAIYYNTTEKGGQQWTQVRCSQSNK